MQPKEEKNQNLREKLSKVIELLPSPQSARINLKYAELVTIFRIKKKLYLDWF